MPRTSLLLFASMSLLAACTGGEDDTGAKDDTDIQDGGVGGDGGTGGDGGDGGDGGGGGDPTVGGVVTGPYSSEPNPYATVYAWQPETDGWTTADTDDDGIYTMTLAAGPWVLEPEADECYGQSVEITLADGDNTVVDLHIDDCITADKPNLYLYPDRPTPTQVFLDLDRRQRVVASHPQYKERTGWRGLALPDGSFRTIRGLTVPFLFYEVSLAPWQARSLPRTEGWCIDGHDTDAAVAAMADILTEYGFNAMETADFIEGWEHDLPVADAYAVWPLTEVDHMADVIMDPPLPLSRLWLVVDDGAHCPAMSPPVVVPFDRSGAHAVEWGLILDDITR